MTSLFGSRRRAEAFAARADEAASGSWTALRDGAAGPDADTDALLELVSALRSVGAADDLATPGDAFSLDLRERLVTEAATVLVAQRAEPDARTRRAVPGAAASRTKARGWARRRRRLATATATVAILMGGTAGMASAAQDSLPGQALYPVKRGMEKAAVTLSGSTVDRGRELLTQASGRLVEVQGLMDAGAAERTQIPGTLDTFNEQAREGAGLLISSYESTDDETAMVTLRNFAASSMDTIEDLATTAPTNETLTGLGDAAVLMHEVDTAADQVCPGCSDLPALPSSDVLALTNAAGAVGFPGAGTALEGGDLLGAIGDPTTDGTLAPLLPGLPAGQGLLGVPGAPAPTETTSEEPPTDTAAGEATTGGSTAGADPGAEAPGTPVQPSDPTTPTDPTTPAEPTTPTEPTPPSDPTPIDPTTPSDPAPSDPSTPTDPPVTDPPATDPPATDPPATENPPVENSPDPEPSPTTAPVEDPGAEQPADGGDQGTEAPTGESTTAAGQS